MKMKYNFILSSALSVLTLILSGCDTPTRTRLDTSSSNNVDFTSTNPGGTGSTTPAPEGTGNGSSGGTSGGTTGGTSGMPAGFQNCSGTPNIIRPEIGNLSACQSSQNELSFRLSFTTTDQSDGTCLIPMTRDNNGKSTYIGRAQCTRHNAGQVIMGLVAKDRNGYSNYSLNSVMFMKMSGLNPFFDCMDEFNRFAQACYSSRYCNNSYFNAFFDEPLRNCCEYYAGESMAMKCNQFKNSVPYFELRLN
jgi:hypothetical protein